MYKTNFELIDQWFESDIDLDSSKKLFIWQFGIHNNYLLSNYLSYKIIDNKLIVNFPKFNIFTNFKLKIFIYPKLESIINKQFHIFIYLIHNNYYELIIDLMTPIFHNQNIQLIDRLQFTNYNTFNFFKNSCLHPEICRLENKCILINSNKHHFICLNNNINKLINLNLTIKQNHIILKKLTNIFIYKKNKLISPFFIPWYKFYTLQNFFNTVINETIITSINTNKQFSQIFNYSTIQIHYNNITFITLFKTKSNNYYCKINQLYFPNSKDYIYDSYFINIKQSNSSILIKEWLIQLNPKILFIHLISILLLLNIQILFINNQKSWDLFLYSINLKQINQIYINQKSNQYLISFFKNQSNLLKINPLIKTIIFKNFEQIFGFNCFNENSRNYFNIHIIKNLYYYLNNQFFININDINSLKSIDLFQLIQNSISFQLKHLANLTTQENTQLVFKNSDLIIIFILINQFLKKQYHLIQLFHQL